MDTSWNQPSRSPSSTPAAGVSDTRPAMLLWVCGKTLILVFLISVIAALLPFNPRSVEWGTQFATRIIDAAFLPLIGVACLRVGSLLPPRPEAMVDSDLASQLWRRRQSAVQLARRGVMSLSLLAVWHVPLLMGSISLIDQRSAANAEALSSSLQREEQAIQRATAPVIESRWLALQRADDADLPPGATTPEQRRQLMIERLRARQQLAGPMASSQGNAARWSLLRHALRSLALCLAYIAGFHALARRRGVMEACG